MSVCMYVRTYVCVNGCGGIGLLNDSCHVGSRTNTALDIGAKVWTPTSNIQCQAAKHTRRCSSLAVFFRVSCDVMCHMPSKTFELPYADECSYCTTFREPMWIMWLVSIFEKAKAGDRITSGLLIGRVELSPDQLEFFGDSDSQ